MNVTSKGEVVIPLDVKVRDNIIPQVTRSKYLVSIVKNDGEIKIGVNHLIQDE